MRGYIIFVNITCHRAQQFFVHFKGAAVEYCQIHIHVARVEEISYGGYGYFKRLVFWVAVYARGYQRKGYAAASVFMRKLQRTDVCRAQQPFGVAFAPIAVYGAGRVYHKLCRKRKAGRNGRAARAYGRELIASLLQFSGACRPENGAANAAAHGKIGVGRVYDRVGIHFGYVLPHYGKWHKFTSPRMKYIAHVSLYIISAAISRLYFKLPRTI